MAQSPAVIDKKTVIDANKRIKDCIYNIKTKVEEAVTKDIYYAKLSNVDEISWKLIEFLAEHNVIKIAHDILQIAKHKKKTQVPSTNFHNRCFKNDHGNTEGNLTKKEKSANKKITNCISQLDTKVKEALNKEVYFAKVSGMDIVSCKLIDCLVADEVVDESIRNKIHTIKLRRVNQGSPLTHHTSPKNRRTPGSQEKHHESKSPNRLQVTMQIERSPYANDCQRRINFDKENVDEAMGGIDTCSCTNYAMCYGCQISQLENEKLDLEKELERSEKKCEKLEAFGNKYQLLATDYINQFQELKKTYESRRPDECDNCALKQQHMKRYKAQRDELRFDKKNLENYIAKILSAKSDETLSLKNKSLEKTIEYQNQVIIEIEKREKQLHIALKDAEQASEYHERMLEKCRKEKDDAKTSLSAGVIENDKLKSERDQLLIKVNRLKNQKQKADEQIAYLTEQLKENENNLQQSKQHNDKLCKNLDEIKRKKESSFRERNELLQQQENNRKLSEENESLKAEIYAFENQERNELLQQQENNRKLSEENESLKADIYAFENQQAEYAEEKKESIRSESKLKLEISNLKIQKIRTDEKVRKLEKDLNEKSLKFKEQQTIFSLERCNFEEEIKKLRLQLYERTKSMEPVSSRSAYCPRSHIYEKEKEEFMDLNTWNQRTPSLQEKSRSAKRHVYGQEDEEFTDLNMGKSVTSFMSLPAERYSPACSDVGRSDTEKENISLRAELTEALKNIEKRRQEYSDLSEKYETGITATKRTIESLQWEKDSLEQEKHDFRAKLDQIQSDLNHYKNEQVHEQDSSHGKIENLLQQNRKLDNDRELLRGKIFSLENDKIKLEDLFNKSKEDNNKLQREQDILQDNLREKSNELKDSGVRLRKLEADIIFLENTKTENDQLKQSLREIEGVKREFENLEKRYQKETSDRMSSDNISTKYKEDNDRLRKERNDSRTELQRVLKEKKESLYQNLNTEKVLAREELQTKEREKLELVALFKDKEDKNLQKIKLYEKEIENLKSRCREDNDKMRQLEHDVKTLNLRCRDDKDKIQRFEHEIYTLKSSFRDDNDQVQRMELQIETLKSSSKDDKDKIQLLESEIETVKSRSRDENNKMRQMEREIKNLKSRLTGEKANQQSAYDVMQYKNDLETCKHQKKALEEERNELQKENNELENELQRLNSKLEQFEDSVRNISNLKKQIKDHEEGYRNVTSKLHEAERQMGEQKETIEDQKQENRKIYKEKKDLENKLRLALNNEEQASLGKECEELKTILQEKQEELYNLKSRFQKLTDSKETSEVLNKIIESLKLENLDLNQRLEINNKEKSSILKENKELKNILQEKLSEVKRLETRLQQYAEKFEDIPALKSHMDKLQSDNDELNLKLQEYAAELEGIPSLKRRIENLQTDNATLEKRGKHKDGLLQKSESTVQKMQKDNQKLQTEIISQNQNYDTLKIKLESLQDKNLELDERLRRRSPVVVAEPKNCQNCFKYRNDISDLKREINDLRDRLSEAAGNKLRDNNPNIADLSDMNRPTSLAEKFSSLYTDEYTDAMEVIEDDMDEAASVKVMLDWLKSCYAWCQRLAKEQRDTLINRSIGFMEDHGGQKVVLSDRCLIFVKEFQKKIAAESLAVVGQICHVKSVTQQTLSRENYIVKYIKKCSELCWMMQISDPPLYLNFDVNSGENLNKNDYNVFTKSGSKIDYLVWPVLYLHKTGPMLAKGVAQGK